VDHPRKAVAGGPVPPHSERRASPRASSRIEVSYEDVEGQVFLPSRDLSEGGIFLLSPTAPAVGVSATLLFELPGNPTILRVRGRVARRQTRPISGFAVRFDSHASPTEGLQHVRDFVERTRTGRSAPRT
jgi:hypothetical protein